MNGTSRRRWIVRGLTCLVTLSSCHPVTLLSTAVAQIVVIDDVILLTNRQKKQQEARTHQHLDPPGGDNLLPPSPGADEPRLGEERISALPLPRVLSRRGKRRGQRGRDVRRRPGAFLSPQSEESLLSSSLELPAEIEEPAHACTQDAAIQRLLAVNTELAAKYQDLPRARADVLTAGLRSNPFLFVSFSNIPYGHFSPQQPASTLYDLTVIQPFEINCKRGYRIQAAQEAKNVLEAQYQDAVRQQIGKLDFAFVDVLEARQAVQALRAGWTRLTELEGILRVLAEKGLLSSSEVNAVFGERANAEVAVQRAEVALVQAQRRLALLLAIPAEQAESLVLAGSLHDRSPPPPCQEELIRIALETRPDLTAYRLGTSRARADLRRERAEAVDNVFLFYTPFTANDYSPLGLQSASGWSLGLLFSVPLFDRNQGDIARARVNVRQAQFDREGLERRIINEVQYAATEYAFSREVVQQYEGEILAITRTLRDEQADLFSRGQASLDSLLEVQKEYDEVVRDYLETLVYHRRTMLRLNFAVGQRILP